MDSAPPDPGVVVQLAETEVAPPVPVPPDPLPDEELPDPPLDEELPDPDVLPDPPLDEEVPDVVEPEVPDAEGDPSLLLPPHPARQSAALNSDTRTLDCCTFLIVFSLSKEPGHDGPGWIGGIDRARWRHLRQATRCQSFKGP